jgi:hypothetical protein
MKRATLALALVLFAVPAWAGGPWSQIGPRARVPYIGGAWYMNGQQNAPCGIIQESPDGNAEFINENGSHAWGTVRGDRVWIPDWMDGFNRRGLRGVIRGDRIIWPDGNFWSR